MVDANVIMQVQHSNEDFKEKGNFDGQCESFYDLVRNNIFVDNSLLISMIF